MRTSSRNVVVAVSALCVIAAVLLAVSRAKPRSETSLSIPPPPKLAAVPIDVTVKQRSTTPIPGSDGQLLVSIDDVTRGQILTSVLSAEKTTLAGPLSLSEGASLPFRWHDVSYSLSLKKLHNAPVGEDFADFVITDAKPAGSQLSETEKIERLIGTIASLQRSVFIRDGAEHSNAEAAKHMRQKWDAKGAEVKTADDFIKLVATQATISGEPYRIRFADGKEVNSADFLRERLAEIEASGPSVAADDPKNSPQ